MLLHCWPFLSPLYMTMNDHILYRLSPSHPPHLSLSLSLVWYWQSLPWPPQRVSRPVCDSLHIFIQAIELWLFPNFHVRLKFNRLVISQFLLIKLLLDRDIQLCLSSRTMGHVLFLVCVGRLYFWVFPGGGSASMVFGGLDSVQGCVFCLRAFGSVCLQGKWRGAWRVRGKIGYRCWLWRAFFPPLHSWISKARIGIGAHVCISVRK